ncbi:MAG: hypothetical protein KJ970_04660 [Candidatus Eisenbacteria bacterium]|uniref:ZU5 domain-containing protein n=1 Tax=Eiseniibacteriota bacterium TaxID=2212470 RepID=A0A948RSI1_UNCEI|nr:hypothetical protein [Candidatus Eisenbacteria bacterium]MBU2690198.1 hypothetical protein [Candidatus Eisenbacteria bacterium]
MRKINSYRVFIPATFAAVIVLMIVGCSDDNSMEPTAAAPQFARIIDGSIESDASMVRSLTPEKKTVTDEGDGSQEYTMESYPIDPKVGGEYTQGRFTLTVPPGATGDTLNLTVKDLTSDRGQVIVELGPHGVEFDQRVTLTIDLSGTTLADYSDVTIYWYNEETGEWVDMNGTYDPMTRSVSAELEHFSLYGGGRAGW